MFAFFHKSASKKPRRRAPRRLGGDWLESRCCLSALSVSLQAAVADGHNVSIQGMVSGGSYGSPYGPAPTDYQVVLSGPVSATVTSDSSGSFSYHGPASGLGTVTANASDSNGDSGSGSTTIDDPGPTVYMLSVSPTGSGKNVIVSGSVSAGSPGGLAVNFSGSAGLATTSTTTDANGNFNLQTTAGQLGAVLATATDIWGTKSPVATTSFSVSPPQIQGFGAISLGDGEWEFVGTVQGPDPSEDSVQITGMTTASATPDSSGHFSVIVYMGDYPNGTAYAVATDVWGQTSPQVSYSILD